MTTFQNINALSVICLYMCINWITKYMKYTMLSKKMGPELKQRRKWLEKVALTSWIALFAHVAA